MISRRPISFSFSIAALIALLLFSLATWAVKPEEAKGALFAVSNGKGKIQLLWIPPLGQWPQGGWQIADSQGKVLVERVPFADPEAMKALNAKDAAQLNKLAADFRSAPTQQKQAAVLGIVGLRAMTDSAFARAAGLAWSLDDVPRGARSYRVTGLSASGQPTTTALTSAPVDSSLATPLPPSPPDVRAEVQRSGVQLFWSPVPQDRKLPVIGYWVERGTGQQVSAVVDKPVIRGVQWDVKIPGIVDEHAPTEVQVSYNFYSLDLFGRRSAPAQATVFVSDLKALVAPEPVSASAQVGKNVVQWTLSKNPNTVGYVVERANLSTGPYEVLTAKGVSATTSSYEDTDVRGGTSYYYRIHAVGPRGDVGPPSYSIEAQPMNVGKPPRPANVKADVGNSRVRLTWDAVKFPVAGYLVQRKNSDLGPTAPWSQLNPRATAEPLYDDYFGLNTSGKLVYRIIAVGFDNQESRPSDEVEAALSGQVSPPTPHILGTDGSGGKIVLSFSPALPAEKTAQFLVLRGGTPEDPGLVIGDPLPASARSFEDDHVQAGQDYWYRLVALDTSGNRSDPTLAVVVRVGTPSLPAAAPPVLAYSASPFPHVKISFSQPPAGLGVVVQRKTKSETSWLTVTGPAIATEALDTNPPATEEVSYRIVYQAEDGAQGPPSNPVTLSK